MLSPLIEADQVFDQVPKIAYTDLMNDNSNIDHLVIRAMKHFGFFYVVDVPDYSAAKELELMTTFFGLPEDVKADVEIRSHNPANSNAYRGYCPGLDDIEATLQYKNICNIGPHEKRAPFFDNKLDDATEKLRYDVQEPNVWPNTDNCTFDKIFKDTFQAGFEIRRGIARAFIRSV